MKMKAIMLTVLFFTIGFFAVQAQEKSTVSDELEVTKENIQVYYFHNTRRCATCEAVESVTKETLKEYYAEPMEKGLLTFQSLDLEDDSNTKLAKELKVSGQSLLIIKNGKKKDLTNDAFMYARSSPDKLQAKIKKVIGTI